MTNEEAQKFAEDFIEGALVAVPMFPALTDALRVHKSLVESYVAMRVLGYELYWSVDPSAQLRAPGGE